MYLSSLSLTNFRNFRQLELHLPPGPVVLHGPNAQGKTSILEAIYLMAIARSFRAENEREVVNWDAAAEGSDALVGGTIERAKEGVKVLVGYQCLHASQSPRSTGEEAAFLVRKQIRVDRVKRTAVELVGVVNAVLFSAEDLNLVHGPPALRRRYLDILLSQVQPGYLRALQRYQRVVQQRNQLLKLLLERRASEDELPFWDGELSKEGSWVLRARYRALGPLSQLAEGCHGELTGGGEALSLEYRPSVVVADTPEIDGGGQAPSLEEVQECFTAALAGIREKERVVGSTLVGPHRDDFRMLVAGADMGTYGSRGQTRTLALALRLAEASYLATQRQDGPIVLLDDVLSELDEARRMRVLEKATAYQQVIISTTDLESLGQEFLQKATCYHVLDGRVTSP